MLDLVVQIADRPVENVGKEVLHDILGDLLRGVAVSTPLAQTLASSILKGKTNAPLSALSYGDRM